MELNIYLETLYGYNSCASKRYLILISGNM